MLVRPTEETGTCGDHWSDSALVTVDRPCIVGLRPFPSLQRGELRNYPITELSMFTLSSCSVTVVFLRTDSLCSHSVKAK